MPPPAGVREAIIPPEQITKEAAYGFMTGASRFLAISIPTHIALQHIHPVYRGLTPQFKVFLQISALTLGGYIWAERRVGEYNDVMRAKFRMLERNRRAWNEDEEVRARVQELLKAEAEAEAEQAAKAWKGKGKRKEKEKEKEKERERGVG